MIKRTTKENPHRILSAYKDNVAFAEGPVVEQFAPARHDTSDYFVIRDIESVISIKAETHNFPTTVEPQVRAEKFATVWAVALVRSPLPAQLST